MGTILYLNRCAQWRQVANLGNWVVLLDVADAVADPLELPTEAISVAMLFRGFYTLIKRKPRVKPPTSLPIARHRKMLTSELSKLSRKHGKNRN